MLKRKTVLFGGTFDPIHIGHIGVARAAIEILRADKFTFIPAKQSALKTLSPVASDADRLKMIQLVVNGLEKFEVSDWELNRPAPSYTIDTVRHFAGELGPDVELHWLLGADSIAELEHWYKIKELIDECLLTFMCRPGYEGPDFSEFADTLGGDRVQKLRDNVIETPLIDVSCTQIRKRLKKDGNVSEMLTPEVAEYISQKRLYR
jgi:nicotinate-nucleotide adenylyltransferase